MNRKLLKSLLILLCVLTMTVVYGQAETHNSINISRPNVDVSGLVVGSDAPTVGLASATIGLTGTVTYSGTTNATGQFTITGIPSSNTYTYTIAKTGYTTATGTINVGGGNYNMGTIILTETPFPPTAVVATEVLPDVNISWLAPNPGALSVTQSFEGTTFPPAGWTQSVTNTGPANNYGVLPTWCRAGTVTISTADIITPQDGAWQAAMWWSYQHQDEWLITPQFNCPAAASLVFQGFIFLGSTHNDHYYVKVSTNNGADWTVLWDAVTVGGYYYSDYTIPFTVSLASYAGQNIKLAWHADDPPTNDGMWNFAMIDNISVTSPTRTITFNENEMNVRSAGPIPAYQITTGKSDYVSKATAEGMDDVIPIIHDIRTDRILTGYKVWRLTAGQETNEAAWTLLTPNTITPTTYLDTSWNAVPDGIYRWAVKALYTNNVSSVPAFSNQITILTQIGTIAGIVRQTNNTPIQDATVTAGNYTAVTNASGAYSMQVPAGEYNVSCSAPGFVNGYQDAVLVTTDLTTTINFVLIETSVSFDGFETYPDFATDFAPWINVDVDQSETFGLSIYDFPGEYLARSFIIFNPYTTVPASTSVIGAPHGGSKMAQSWAADTPPNNDWMISRSFNVNNGAHVGFWARSMTADYGLERFKVGVSTGGTLPSNFTIISPGAYVEAPVAWTYFQYNIPNAFIPGTVRIGINCVSDYAYVFMVDDFTMTLQTTSAEEPVTPVIATTLLGNYPNPFNPETVISYATDGKAPVSIDVYNLKGQKVKTLINEIKAAGNHAIRWNGTDDNHHSVSSGIYYYKMSCGSYSSTKKMILLK